MAYPVARFVVPRLLITIPDLILRQWQRIAISRAFMRADRPEVDLLLFDEPVSDTTLVYMYSQGLADIITGCACSE